MLRELLSIFRADNPLKAMADNFAEMLKLACDLTVLAGTIYFEKTAPPDERTRVYKQDIKINKLERVIRKQVIGHLAIRANSPNLPYCLVLMSLVKDVERIGDYAKNLAEVMDFCPTALPDDEATAELREIRRGIEEVLLTAARVFDQSDDEQAVELIRAGRDIAHRSDTLVATIARSDYDAGTAVGLVLGARYYKRINGHILNVLSSVVMPLHKLDYYDEDEMPVGAAD